MADIDRYLAACEDREADRRLSDEDQREDDLMSDADWQNDCDKDREMEDRP